jgi:hypothetical protein
VVTLVNTVVPYPSDEVNVSVVEPRLKLPISHRPNEQSLLYQRPCCPEYVGVAPENVARRVPWGRKHELVGVPLFPS